jgi:hypothetical protein
MKNWKKNLEDILKNIETKKRAKYRKNGRLPYAYVLPKNKDISRCRPVVSYYNHPHKRLLNLCSRAVAGMLKRIESSHCILWKTGDLLERMRENIDALVNGRDDAIISVRAYDIKNFYTCLSHDEIRKAYFWMVSELKKCVGRRCKYVNVSNDRSEKIRIDSKMNVYGWHSFDFDMLFNIINMDLNNTIFSVGDVLLKQKKGVPMGSPISPVLAIMVAAYYENMFYLDCGSDAECRFRGMRYVDDILAMAVYDEKKIGDEKKMLNVLDKFENCYHEDLTLEKESIIDGNFVFLEGEIMMYGNDKMLMRYKNVNWNYICENGKQKIRRYMHWKSYTSRKVKSSTILGAMSRILVHSSTERNARESLVKLFMEFSMLEYPFSFIKRCVMKKMRKEGEECGLWLTMVKIIDGMMELEKMV